MSRKSTIQNPYIVQGFNSIHLKTIKHNEIIDVREYLNAIRMFESKYVYVVDETDKHRRLVKDSLERVLLDYVITFTDKLRCDFKKDKVKFKISIPGIDEF